jgi:putative transposase
VDNGTEFTSKALDEWAYRRGIKLDYTRPGKPTDNGLIESFNGRLRDEFLNVQEFVTLHDAREKLKAWQLPSQHSVASRPPMRPQIFNITWKF